MPELDLGKFVLEPMPHRSRRIRTESKLAILDGDDPVGGGELTGKGLRRTASAVTQPDHKNITQLRRHDKEGKEGGNVEEESQRRGQDAKLI